MKTLFVALILFSFAASAASANENIWVKQAGKKLIIGAKKNSGKLTFQDDNLDLFCERSQEYLKNFVSDYKKYRCAKNHEFSRVLCKLILETITKNASGSNDFATHLDETQRFKVYKTQSDIDWSRVKQKVAKAYSKKTSDVFVFNELETPSSSWEITYPNKYGFFSSLLTIMDSKKSISSPAYSPLEGFVENRYLACALKNEEVSVSKRFISKAKIEERYDSNNLSVLWKAYQGIQSDWYSLAKKEKEGTIQLLFLGNILKDARSKFFEINQKSISSLSFQFKTYFESNIVDEELNIQMRDFTNKLDFEDKMFPPKKIQVNYSTEISTGED